MSSAISSCRTEIHNPDVATIGARIVAWPVVPKRTVPGELVFYQQPAKCQKVFRRTARHLNQANVGAASGLG